MEHGPVSDPPFALSEFDHVLSTTRAVRRRLDLERPVERELLLDCLSLAQQAPTPSNAQHWRWIIVTDAEKRAAIAELYRKSALGYLRASRHRSASGDPAEQRVYDSALWLAENLEHIPVHVIACVKGRLPDRAPPSLRAAVFGGIFPAIWSFELALHSRGLGSSLTTLHLAHESEVAQLLDIPNDVMQVALLPVAYTKGGDFKPAHRRPVDDFTHWNGWTEGSP